MLDYVLEGVIHQGPTTTIHAARRLPGGQRVAVKVAREDLDAPERRRAEAGLRAEAERLERLGRLGDPGIVAFVELVDGGLDPGAGGGPVALVVALAEDGAPDAASRARPLPRPRPRASRRDSGDRRRPLVVGAAVSAAIVLAGLGVAWSVSTPRSRPVVSALDPAPDPTPDAARPKPPCPGSNPALPAGAVAVTGDTDGTGCTVTVVWWPERAEAERPEPSGTRTRFVMGDPGDQLLLGDWDGDGRDTPALYDPTRGELTRFAGWADADEALEGTVQSGAVRSGGLAGVVHRAQGDEIEVRPSP